NDQDGRIGAFSACEVEEPLERDREGDAPTEEPAADEEERRKEDERDDDLLFLLVEARRDVGPQLVEHDGRREEQAADERQLEISGEDIARRREVDGCVPM